MIFVFMLIAGWAGQENLNSYTYKIKNASVVTSYDTIDALLPSGQTIKIPILNDKVPVLFIENSTELILDYDDSESKFAYGKRSFSYCNNISQNKIISDVSSHRNGIKKEKIILDVNINQINVDQNKIILDTFLSIKKEIDELKSINKSNVYIHNEDLLKFSNEIKELKDMAVNISNRQMPIVEVLKKTDQETNNNFNEIKSMVIEVRKELVDIQKKIVAQTEKKKDIIEPNLPIHDNVVNPSVK